MFLFFFWIIFGGLVGWTVGIVRGARGLNPTSAYVGLGIVGGLLGGYGSTWLLEGGPSGYGNDLTSMMFAIVGSVIIVIILATTDRGRS
ncbi:MAG TPA: hypothetical protein VFT16_00700 [Candidatus Saccharimonadales bacterium]|nr:hypothetical protein [Candidatus Saccharimonadales bacterium]